MKNAKKPKKQQPVRCEDCEHYDVDENGEYFCTAELDEDEAASLRLSGAKSCPYFKFYDEYKSVQKQN